jgi:hypothetical protein
MKSKLLIVLVIAVALLVGASYLFFQISGATQPSASAKAPGSLHQKALSRPHGTPAGKIEPSARPVTTKNPGTLPQKPIQARKTAVSRIEMEKEPVHHETSVPLYHGPTKLTGDNCSNPIVVSLPAQLPYNDLSDSTCGRGNDYDATCLGYYDGGEDIIYELDVTATTSVDIVLDPKGTTWTGIALDVACPPGSTCLASHTNSSGTAHGIYGYTLNPGTYYIMIDTWPSPTCIPNFDLHITAATPPPANDNCGSATPIGDVTNLAWSTTFATHDQSGTCLTSPNIWYVYTATCSGNAHVSLCGSSFDTKLAVYDGYSCSPLPAQIGCNDDACNGGKALQSELYFTAVSGNQYLIEVGGYSNNTGDGVLTTSCQEVTEGACCNNDSPYDCQLLNEADCNALGNHTWKGAGTTCTPNPCYPPPSNDDCANAIELFPPTCPTVQTVYGTCQGATIDCPGILDWAAVWYKFTLPYDCNKLDINYCPTTEPTLNWRGVVMYNLCPTNDEECGQYIFGTGWEWLLCGDGHYDLHIWWNNLPPGTYYLPVLSADADMNPLTFGFDICMEECPPAQSGEDCAHAIVVPGLPYETTGNSCGFVNDYDEACPYTGSTSPDVVYSYTPAADQAINISLCNSGYDTKVFVYEDVCASGTAIACNDDACGDDGYKSAIYGLSLSAGHTYFIVVDGYGGGCGDYDLLITEAGAAPPNDNCDGAIAVSAPTCPDYVEVSGTTIGATLDCPDVLGWNAVWYKFELPYASNKLYLDYCPTINPIGQVGIVIYNSCPPDCPSYIVTTAYQWVTCPNGNTGIQMWWNGLPAGTYYLPVAVWDYNGSPFMDFIFDACIQELTTPPNDNCANATPIGDVINLPFSTVAATFDGPGLCQTAPNIWYDYTATCNGAINVHLCGSLYDTKLAVYDGNSCPPTTMLGCNDDACGGTLQSELKNIPVVQGNHYLIEVGGYSTYTGDGVVTCTCYVPPPPPPNDNCDGAITLDLSTCPTELVVNGTTIGATVDCPGVLDWDAVWYTFTLPYASNDLFVDFCAMPFDLYSVGAVMFAQCPPDCYNPIYYTTGAFVDCPNGTYNAQLWYKNLPAGQYWLPIWVEDYNYNTQMDFSFGICAKEHLPCVVTCPPNGIPENEPICYDEFVDTYNGGCNSVPPAFNQTVNCHDTICGTSGYYYYGGGQYRDTDWFPILVGDGNLTFTCVAEFPVQILLIDPGPGDCSSGSYTVVTYALGDECDTTTLSYYVTGGMWWLWVGPQWVSTWIDCGKKYTFWTDCVPYGPQMAVTPNSFDQTLNPTGACSTATKNLFISSIGGEDLTWSIAENPPAGWLAESPLSGTLPPGQTDTLAISFDAGGMAPGDYNTNLEITNNAAKGMVTVPVHLKVELPPEIDMAARLWEPIIPGCPNVKDMRVDNLGTGDLTFTVRVSGAPPLAAPQGINQERMFNQVPNRKAEDFFRSNAPQSMKSNLPALTTSAAAEASKVNTRPSGPQRAAGSRQNVIWDNGTDVGFAYSSQLDDVYPFDSQVADDFILDASYSITDVHWWGAFWNGPPNEVDPCDFYIYIYADDGTGNAPTGAGMDHPQQTALATYFFPQLTGYPLSPYGNYEYNATLSPAFPANAGVKYWIAIQANFAFPPQWGWVNTDMMQLHTAVQGFPLLGYPFWTMNTGVDMAFYLTGEAPCPMTVSPSSGTIPPASYTDLTLTFDGSAFEVCGLDTTVCYLVFTSNDCDESQVTVPVYMWAARGDVNADCNIDIVDVVFLLNYVFKGGPAPSPLCVGDVNRSGGNPDSDDALYLISYLFLYGPPPEIPLAPKGNENIKIKTNSLIR